VGERSVAVRLCHPNRVVAMLLEPASSKEDNLGAAEQKKVVCGWEVPCRRIAVRGASPGLPNRIPRLTHTLRRARYCQCSVLLSKGGFAITSFHARRGTAQRARLGSDWQRVTCCDWVRDLKNFTNHWQLWS
jgi:hypothetical protein